MNRKKLILAGGVAFALCRHGAGSTVDTTQVFVSGLPPVEFTFNSDGQAFTANGTPVNGLTFGFNPTPPCDQCAGFGGVETPRVPPPSEIPPTTTPLQPPIPVGDTPEPESGQFVVGGLALLAMGVWAFRGRRRHE